MYSEGSLNLFCFGIVLAFILFFAFSPKNHLLLLKGRKKNLLGFLKDILFIYVFEGERERARERVHRHTLEERKNLK